MDSVRVDRRCVGDPIHAGPDPGGMIMTILWGIAGALLGGRIGRVLGWYGEGDPVGFIMSWLGPF